MALALTQPEPYGPPAVAAVREWVAPLRRALAETDIDERQAAARAPLLISGLALDRYLTGDRRRTDDAARLLVTAAVAGR